MSIALLEHLLAFSNQAKWLAASFFLLLSLPVFLPLLFLCSFLGLMLLLPLGCALVGFLSWQRLRQPAAAVELYPSPIRDEKQGNLLHFLLVNSGFVKCLLSLLLISQLERLIEWVEKGTDSCICSDEESNKRWGDDGNHHHVSRFSKRDGNDAKLGGMSEGDVFFWYNPLASIFDAEKQMLVEGAEEVGYKSSISDADHEEIAEIYRSKNSDDLFSKGEWPIIDFDNESVNDQAFYHEILLSDDDYSKEAPSPKLNVEGYDLVEEQSDLSDKPECFFDEQNCSSDLLLADVEQISPLFNEQEGMWYQEMQLELEKYEAFYALDPADKHHKDWIDRIDTGAVSHNERQVDWFSASDASSDANKKGKKGKTSISSLLSATTGSGSISMTSTVSSTSSSSSTTWSACSDQESQANLSDGVPSKKGSNDGLGRKGISALNHSRKYGGRSDRLIRVLGAERQEGGCAGQSNKQMEVSGASRKKVVGASARLLGARADCGRRGCVEAVKEAMGAQLNGQGRKLVCRRSTADSVGEVRGTASRVGPVAGGCWRVAAEEAKRVSAVQEASNYTKNGKNKSSSASNTARLSTKGAGTGGGGGGAVRNQSTCPTNTRVLAGHVTGDRVSAGHIINKRRGHVTGGLEAPTSAGGGGSATSEVEDVRRRLLHVNSEDVYKALPPYAHIQQHASHEYPQFYQLLEFWRGIERAFTSPTLRRGTSL